MKIRFVGTAVRFLLTLLPFVSPPFPMFRHSLLVLLVPGLLAACSTTEHIPAGEQLYTGIRSISYQMPDASRATNPERAAADSVGVISAIAGAVDQVEDVLSGRRPAAPSLADLNRRDPKTLSKAERARLNVQRSADQANLGTAKEEVSAVLAYAPNGALFGSSSVTMPWKFGLRMYNAFVNDSTRMGRWLFRTFAEAPVLVSNVAPEMRTKVAVNTLRKYGYFRARADFRLLPGWNPKTAKIAYTLWPGSVFYLDSVEYRGFDAVADSLLRHTWRERLLRSGQAFSAARLSSEQQRIETLMRNNGYYFYAAGHTTFAADTVARPGFVQLRVQPHPRQPLAARRPWYIGHTHISLRDLDGTPLDREQTLRDFTFTYAGQKLPLRAGMWRRAIAHRRGERYSLSDQQSTFDRLYAIGILSALDVDYVPRDTTQHCDTLDLYINATLGRRYDSAFEMNATLKSNQQFGPGVSYELSKLNAFRGGETVAWKLFGSYEWQLGGGRNGGNALLNSFEFGTQLSLKFPRLMTPWNTNARRQRRLKNLRAAALAAGHNDLSTYLPFRFGVNRPVVGSTTFALNADAQNRSGFFRMLTLGGDVVYKWYRDPMVNHELSLFDLSYNRILSTTTAFDSITTANPALYVSMRNQFVPSVSYLFTLRSGKADHRPFWLQLSVKEAGHLTSAIYALTGRSWHEQDKRILGVPFAQFIKATAEVRYARPLTSGLRLATRFFAGAVVSWGNSTRAPYSEQFFVGGANSIRAFSARTVGPGSFYAPGSRYAYIDQTGDFKLEANAELRARLFGSLHGACFIDAGNVWLLRSDPLRPDAALSMSNLRRIAIGTGVGLRYDLDYLVLRFDVGVGIHAPYATGHSGFFNFGRWNDALAYHFAIGYPF